MTISKVFKPNPKEGLFGMEIEVEGRRLPFNYEIEKYWRAEQDGSLRGESLEYVLKEPLDRKEIEEAVNVLYKNLDGRIRDSVRAGIHVHLNVQNYSILDFFKLMTLYLSLEQVYTHYCGPTREGNLFCLRSNDAEWYLFNLMQAVHQRRFNPILGDMNRYSSLNLDSLRRYGSVEFRSMGTTVTSGPVLGWIDLIEDLHNAVGKFKDPKDVVYSVSENNFSAFVKYAIPNAYKHVSYMEKELGVLVREGVRNAQLLAFCEDDWTQVEEGFLDGRKRPKKRAGFGEAVLDHIEPDLNWAPNEGEEVRPQPLAQAGRNFRRLNYDDIERELEALRREDHQNEEANR